MPSGRTFFFYGTLLDAEIRDAVMGAFAPPAVEPATLAGWRRLKHPDASYPIIVAAENATVAGVIARDLAPAAVSLLVAYEGTQYAIAAVDVLLAGGGRQAAELFVPVASFPGSGKPWDLASWQRSHKRQYLAGIRRAPHPDG